MTEVRTPIARRLACARCGAAFDCGLSKDCWCAAEPYRLPMTEARAEDCLCPTCLRAATRAGDRRDAGSDG